MPPTVKLAVAFVWEKLIQLPVPALVLMVNEPVPEYWAGATNDPVPFANSIPIVVAEAFMDKVPLFIRSPPCKLTAAKLESALTTVALPVAAMVSFGEPAAEVFNWIPLIVTADERVALKPPVKTAKSLAPGTTPPDQFAGVSQFVLPPPPIQPIEAEKALVEKRIAKLAINT